MKVNDQIKALRAVLKLQKKAPSNENYEVCLVFYGSWNESPPDVVAGIWSKITLKFVKHVPIELSDNYLQKIHDEYVKIVQEFKKLELKEEE